MLLEYPGCAFENPFIHQLYCGVRWGDHVNRAVGVHFDAHSLAVAALEHVFDGLFAVFDGVGHL